MVHSSVPYRAALDGVVQSCVRQCLACSVCAHCWSGGTACVARSFILSHHATLAADEATAGSVMNMRLPELEGKHSVKDGISNPNMLGHCSVISIDIYIYIICIYNGVSQNGGVPPHDGLLAL